MKSSKIAERLANVVPAAIIETKELAKQLGYGGSLRDVYETLFVAVLIKHLRKSKVHTLHEATYSTAWRRGTADIAISRSSSNKRCKTSDGTRAIIEVKWLGSVNGIASDLRKLCWAQANNRFVLGVPTTTRSRDRLTDAGADAIVRATSNRRLGWNIEERDIARAYLARKDVSIKQHDIPGAVLLELTVPPRKPFLVD